ncbi:MAG: serine/threonine protein kinase [Gammaproteobacteria bacterium]|nr:serine/threonine protein kinase [Gammaproteobacteria bacterium]
MAGSSPIIADKSTIFDKSVFSFKSNAWQLGLTGCLLLLTYLAGMTGVVSGLEYELFEYIITLQPDRLLSETYTIRPVPGWARLLLYTMIFAMYVRKYTRSRTTAVSFLTLIIILFFLLMVEILFAVFYRVFIPVILPVMLMLLVSSVYWVNDLYQRFAALKLLVEASVSLDDIRQNIEAGELKSALILLKQCQVSDDLLELGYELGMLLESRKRWASALNLYHWLSRYDPGLCDFVTRVEEIKANRKPLVEKTNLDSKLKNINHYQLLKKIASGATATVYEGYDLRTHNRVALKVMSSRLDEDEEGDRIKHWLHEAEIVSLLDHPNIVRIHDAAIFDDTPYIAMNYISGYSMAQRLRRREYITVGECIRICKSVLHALTEAHRSGVIHGDIKPANIMYDDREKTYIVTDFGAAYSQGKRGHNVIVGTPAYMSPEQLEGRKIDGRSDLFSLAVTLYHLLTGYPPFTGSSLPQLKQSIINDEPDLDHLTLPAGILEVIMKALQKKTYMRFADAQQMLTAVEYCEKQMLDRIQH